MALRSRIATVATLSLASAVMFLAPVSCSRPEPPFRVAIYGFAEGEPGHERSEMLSYACDKVEAELGAEAEMMDPGGNALGSGTGGTEDGAYRLVIALGKSAAEGVLASRQGASDVPLVALGLPPDAGVSGGDGVTAVRYRVEEGAYLCGYLAGRLTEGKDHPLTNALPVVAFLGAKSDAMTEWYRAGFVSGVKAALPAGNVLVYTLEDTAAASKARSLAEEAAKKGADIVFCAPGEFVSEVIEVAEEKNILVIPAGADLHGSSPEHVLTSLILRDDNAVFRAVQMAMDGKLVPGQFVWGIREGTWCLAPFRGHDLHVRRELKEALQREEERVAGMEFSP
ncbi:MAG: BMP family ABC transporter substrate-binding protein [Actinobacteria bacterium]|nr:BMP family ABC transporter substrate-binding protein [Actinomycetota bacterium]